MLRACDGGELESRRDAAIVRLFADTGMRCAELAGLRCEDLDLEQDTALVLGKGRRPRLALHADRDGRRVSPDDRAVVYENHRAVLVREL